MAANGSLPPNGLPGLAGQQHTAVPCGLPVFDIDQSPGDGAAALDLGPTLTFPTGKGELGLSAGATAFLVGDYGEFTDGGIGGFVAGHATAWLSGNLGAVAGAMVRVSGRGGAYPSLSAGLAVRF